MSSDPYMGRSSPRSNPLSVPWPRRVCKLLDSDCDPTPDSRPSVIPFRCSLLGTPEAIHLALVSVTLDHQHRDAPDLDLPYHAGNDSRPCVSNCLKDWPNLPWSGSLLAGVQIRRNFAFRPKRPNVLSHRVSLVAECPSGSVHARVRRLQAIDREQARLDRPHCPATRRDPKLLPVFRAAKLLSRSTGHTRRERPFTPKAALRQGAFRSRFERCGRRPPNTGWGAHNLREIGHRNIIRIGRQCFNI
jgi:hypothetical protein